MVISGLDHLVLTVSDVEWTITGACAGRGVRDAVDRPGGLHRGVHRKWISRLRP